MSILTATVAEVSIGHIRIEGLLASDGVFYAGVPQIAGLFSFPIKHASRDFKALLQAGSQSPTEFLKAKTPLNSKAVNVLTLAQVESLMVELSLKGDAIAVQMVRDLVGLSLYQLFCDAFEIEFDAQDRQDWLCLRQESKSLFWALTQQIDRWIKNRECSQPKWKYYSGAFDCINLQLFGLKSKAIREELGIKEGGLNRDHFGRDALRHITQVQETAARTMAAHPEMRPTEAIKMVVAASFIERSSYLN